MNAMNTPSNNEHELQPFDVLCGRDKKCYNNIGNRRFRILINSNLPRYLDCLNRPERSAMIFALTKELCCCKTTCSPIRFFKKQKHSEGLIELDFKGCREKIGHALRDAASQHNSHNKSRDNNKYAVKSHRCSHRLSLGLSISSLMFDNLKRDDSPSLASSLFDISRNPNKNDNDDPIPFAFDHRTSNISVLTAAFDEFARTLSSSSIESFAF